MTNEAAERLLDELGLIQDEFENVEEFPGSADIGRVAIAFRAEGIRLVTEALAAERRATVERIREGYHGDKSHWFGQWLDQLLAEEAAR